MSSLEMVFIMCVCACVRIHICRYMCEHELQMEDVFLNCSSPYY